MALPTLYHLSKKKVLHSWRIWTEGPTIYTEFGQVGGKLQQTVGKTCEAVNVGKANERNADQQAIFTAAAMHKHKLDRKYALSPDDATEAKDNLPMLAHRYDQRPKYVKFPCDLQPKLDGNRGNARWLGNAPELVARSGIDTYDLAHLQQDLAFVLRRTEELDGELYVHGVSPQTINSWVQKAHPESVNVKYHVYDMPIVDGKDDLPWVQRRDALRKLAAKFPDSLVLVETVTVNSKAEIDAWLEKWLAAGYEGAMIRNHAGVYEWGDRSNDLQKVKVFEDAEFKIVGCEQGVGKMAGCAIWVCEVGGGKGKGKSFTCTMKAPMEERRKQYANRSKYIGQMMTVSYFGFFDSGLPRFPRAVKFRLSKDR